MKDTLGKPTVETYSQVIQDEYSGLILRRRELNAQMNQHTRDINQTQLNLGAAVAAGGDYGELGKRLNALRLGVESMELGIKAVEGKMSLLKRSHPWLKVA